MRRDRFGEADGYGFADAAWNSARLPCALHTPKHTPEHVCFLVSGGGTQGSLFRRHAVRGRGGLTSSGRHRALARRAVASFAPRYAPRARRRSRGLSRAREGIAVRREHRASSRKCCVAFCPRRRGGRIGIHRVLHSPPISRDRNRRDDEGESGAYVHRRPVSTSDRLERARAGQ